ncbi:uncharacterized protein LOC114239265 [Bombyx mandarina]|uniref:Uncharacterized protein n=2 Tax=Bombyx TaxID=7090 RepID=A0A8R1WPP5_BOMMO|nr:uncharacterized protein LOC101740950 [Bombyx mori]XP_028025186.1 uncharacterized protein LOC114239265 [Bombyx mandarina]
MALQRARHTDALQRIMISFKHFEKKLDKLQDDVNDHGKTLGDLKTMVSKLSQNTVIGPESKLDDWRVPFKTSASVQYEETKRDSCSVPKRKKNIQPLPIKSKAKSLQNQNIIEAAFPISVPPKIIRKRSPRTRKVETPRKTPTLRSHKGLENKHSKLKEQIVE